MTETQPIATREDWEHLSIGPQANDPPERSLRIALIGLASRHVQVSGVHPNSAMYELLSCWYAAPRGWNEMTLDTEWCLQAVEIAEQMPRAIDAAQAMRQWMTALEYHPDRAFEGHRKVAELLDDIGGWGWELAMQVRPQEPSLWAHELRRAYGCIAVRALALGPAVQRKGFGTVVEAIEGEPGALDPEAWKNHVEKAREMVSPENFAARKLALGWIEVVECEVGRASPPVASLLRTVLWLTRAWERDERAESSAQRRAQSLTTKESDRIAERIARLAEQCHRGAGRWTIERTLRPLENELRGLRTQLESNWAARNSAIAKRGVGAGAPVTDEEQADGEQLAKAVTAAIESTDGVVGWTANQNSGPAAPGAAAWLAHAMIDHEEGRQNLRERLRMLAHGAKRQGCEGKHIRTLQHNARGSSHALTRLCAIARNADIK